MSCVRMTSVQAPGTSGVNQATAKTLRQLLEANALADTRVPFAKAVDLVVPLCVEVSEVHAQGYGVHIHPSNLIINDKGSLSLAADKAAMPPQHPKDQACLPPESQGGELGSAASSVYSIGAILYEMLTGATAGRGMRRPSELVPGLPKNLETLMAKALIADETKRPGDLKALAQALYGMTNQATVPPPPAADMSHLDHIGDLDVDVSLSMLPPEPGQFSGAAPASAVAPMSTNGFNVAVTQAARPAPQSGATAELTQLKNRLESDPTPRYVVVKDGMDHGPFNAVELLQQIGTHTFVDADVLRNDSTGEERAISDWEDFAPFAQHARLHRDAQAEKAAIHLGVAQESKRTKGKAFVGLLVLGVLLLGAASWFVTQVGTRSDEVAIQTETVSNIEAEGNLNVKKKVGGGGGKRVVGSSGGIPILAGGQSCEGAQAAYVEEMKMTGGGQADITRGQYASIMNSGSYFSHCGVPFNVAVSICVAVQNGKAVGVTVSTSPKHSSRSCIASAVRRMSFPAHPKLDVVRVNFAAE